jgi:hypothetical protein
MKSNESIQVAVAFIVVAILTVPAGLLAQEKIDVPQRDFEVDVKLHSLASITSWVPPTAGESFGGAPGLLDQPLLLDSAVSFGDNLSGSSPIIASFFSPAIAADFNGDGFVDGSDFNIWNDHKNSTFPAGAESHAKGDANLDGVVDSGDLQVWQDTRFSP